jgi:SPP1 gp7 family putative phage head morphogenesis protein
MNIFDALSQHQAYKYRNDTKSVNDITAIFSTSATAYLSKLRDLLDEMSQPELTALSSASYTTPRLKEFRTLVNEWHSSMHEEIALEFTASAVALATYEAGYMARLYGETVEPNGEQIVRQAKKMPVAGGALFDEIIQNVADANKVKFLHAVRNGIASGQTTTQIVNAVKKNAIEMTKQDIDRDVRTIRNHVGNTAYVDTFKALGYPFVKFVATLDGRTSKTCASYDGKVWAIDTNHPTPPLHYRCRSVLVGVEKKTEKLVGERPFVAADKPVSKIPKDQRAGLIGQVDANTTFKKWFETQDAQFQKDWLGASRYKLFKDGGMTLDKFTDPQGLQYTLAQLRAKDEAIFKKLGI